MTLTEEQYGIVEKMAGLSYTIKQIAMYLGVKTDELHEAYEDKESDFTYHYDRGRLIAQADIDMKLLESAKGGNITAIQQLQKTQKLKNFENIRNMIVDGHS